MAATSMRLAFVKLKVKPRSRPRQKMSPPRSQNQLAAPHGGAHVPLGTARRGHRTIERKVDGSAGYVVPILARVLTVPAQPKEWWQELSRQILAAAAILLTLGGAVYLIASNERAPERNAYKPLPLPDTPALRRRASRHGHEDAARTDVASQENRLPATDDSFLASAQQRGVASADGNRQLAPARSVPGNGGVRYMRGECVIALRPGEITAAEIGECLRNSPKD